MDKIINTVEMWTQSQLKYDSNLQGALNYQINLGST